MKIDKRNYRVSIPYINKLFNYFIFINRKKIYDFFIKKINCNIKTRIIDIGTTPLLEKHENILFHSYKWKKKLTGFSNQDCTNLKKKFKKSNFIFGDARKIKLKQNSFDVSFCSATIEHVGSFKNQKKIISELYRISKKAIFLTTPNRNFPVDFHTKLPLIHWLPKKIHRKILFLIGLKFYSKEENLNLLSTTDLINLLNNFDTIQYEVRYLNFLGFKSNCIIFGKIINSS